MRLPSLGFALLVPLMLTLSCRDDEPKEFVTFGFTGLPTARVAVGETFPLTIQETVTNNCHQGCYSGFSLSGDSEQCPSKTVSLKSIQVVCDRATCEAEILGGQAIVNVTSDLARTVRISFTTHDVEGRVSSGSKEVVFAQPHHIEILRALESTPEDHSSVSVALRDRRIPNTKVRRSIPARRTGRGAALRGSVRLGKRCARISARRCAFRG